MVVASPAARRVPLTASPPTNATVAELDRLRASDEACRVARDLQRQPRHPRPALATGVPLVVGPALPDDAEHGARVAWAGAGLMVPKRLLGPRSMRAAIRRVLNEPRFAIRAAEIASSGIAERAPRRAADLVESIAPAQGR